MVDQRKAFSLISSRDHCQRSSPSWISDTPRAGFEPAQNLSSSLVERSCAVVITATPRRHVTVSDKVIVDMTAFPYHFHPFYRHSDFSQGITEESSKDISKGWLLSKWKIDRKYFQVKFTLRICKQNSFTNIKIHESCLNTLNITLENVLIPLWVSIMFWVIGIIWIQVQYECKLN